MRNKLFIMSIVVLILLPCLAFGQQGATVKGVVTDDAGNPLPGANVLVQNTNYGAATNVNGAFNFTMPANLVKNQEMVLVARFVGYKTGTATITLSPGEITQNFSLQVDPIGLDAVVVVGYGEARKEELTGSIEVITAEKLTAIPTTTFQDVIQGTPGVHVTSRDGAPGAGINVRIRGIGSITAGSEPLYVVDGIPMHNADIGRTEFDQGGRQANNLAGLNPNDIESLVVLKDAASTAIYGSRGANGVVLITTKGGVHGTDILATKPKLELKISRGFSGFAHGNLLRGLNGQQYHDYFVEARMNTGKTREQAEQLYTDTFPVIGNTNWWDEMTKTGITSQYDLSATGGSNKFTYFVSGSYWDQQGNVIETFFKRYSSRINLTAQLTDKFSIANNLNLSYTKGTGIEDGSGWEAPFYMLIFMPPAVPVKNAEGQYYGAHKDKNIMGGNNPVGGQYDNPKRRETSRIIDNLMAKFQLNPMISFQSSWSFDIYNVDDYLMWNERYGDGRRDGGRVNEARSDLITWQGIQTANYTNTFSANHNVSAVVGYEANNTLRDRVEVWGYGFAHPDLRTVDSASLIPSGGSDRIEYSFASVFARLNYDYNNKYYISGSFRRDGSSRFGPDKRWGNFWSVGFGYTLTEESFMQDITFLDYLKLRTSYGQTGNASIGNYDWQGLYDFDAAYDGTPGAFPQQVANTELTWESQGAFNVGFDYAFMNNKFSGSIEYYKKTSTDLLLNVPISWTTGFTSILRNFGDMENSGIEFSMHAEIMRKRDFDLSVNFNITSQNNKITKLESPFVDGTKKREEGRDYQEYFLLPWAGVDPENGKPLYYTKQSLLDADPTRSKTTSKTSETERIFTGKSATPDFLGSFGLAARWKGFTFSAQANYVFGHYLYEGAERFYHGDGRYLPRSTSSFAWENRWQKPGDDALFPQAKWGGNSGSQPSNSDRWLKQGDFIRLKNVRLGYNIPKIITDKMRLGSLEAYINLYNYYTWVADEYLTFDPEQTISGVYNTGTPNAKTVTFGWIVGF